MTYSNKVSLQENSIFQRSENVYGKNSFIGELQNLIIDILENNFIGLPK